MITRIFEWAFLSSIPFLLTWHTVKPVWIKILVPILVTLLFGYFFFKDELLNEDDADDEDQGFNLGALKGLVKYVLIPLLLIVLVIIGGRDLLHRDALEEQQLKEAQKELKQKAIDTLYEIKSGSRLDFVDVSFDFNRNGEIEAEETKPFMEIDERDGYWKLTPVLGVDNSYYFNSTGSNKHIVETKPPENAFKAYSGDVVKIKIKGPRRTEHCARPPLVKWGIASSSGATTETKIFSLGIHRVEIVGQGYPVVDVFCPTELGDLANVSVKMLKLEKI